MALFSRGKRAPDTVPDSAFPYWSAGAADEFRATVHRAFAEAGSEVEVFADHVVDSNGKQFGLGNIAALCHNDERGPRVWPDLVLDHVRRITASMGASDFDRLTDDQVLTSTYCRIMPTQDLLPTLSYAQEVGPGIALVFNLDLPETVQYFMNDHVARFGTDALMAAGMRNLRTVREDTHETLDHSGGAIDVLLGESVFTASQVLVLDEVAARHGFAIDPDKGAFVAMPNRNQLDFHVVRDETAVPSLQLLAGFANAGYRDASGPISPNVFWWRPGSLEQISRTTDDGIRIEVGPELGDVLNRLSGA